MATLKAASLERLILGVADIQLLSLTSSFSSAPLLSGLAASHWDDVEAAASLKRLITSCCTLATPFL
jgi:hypothetical protein